MTTANNFGNTNIREDQSETHVANIHEGASHARQQLPEVEPSTTSMAEDGQATTTANNYGNTSLREDQSEGGAWCSGRKGCINEAFRKGMTPTDANYVETVTRRNFGS
jgi:hypothetical protein